MLRNIPAAMAALGSLAILATLLVHPLHEEDSVPDPIPLPQGLQGQGMRQALDEALLAILTAYQGSAPASPIAGQWSEDPTTLAVRKYDQSANPINLWHRAAGPFAILPKLINDDSLVVWSQAEPTPGADEQVIWVGDHTWFELATTSGDKVVTLPSMTIVTGLRPLGFINVGPNLVTFQEQQFPSVPGETFINGQAIDLELDPGEWVLLGATESLAGDVAILAQSRGVARTITFADSPYTMAWWEVGKPMLVDASGGAVVINLPNPAHVLPFIGAAGLVQKIDATANTVTVGSVSGNINGVATKVLAAQWAGLRAHPSATDWFDF